MKTLNYDQTHLLMYNKLRQFKVLIKCSAYVTINYNGTIAKKLVLKILSSEKPTPLSEKLCAGIWLHSCVNTQKVICLFSLDSHCIA